MVVEQAEKERETFYFALSGTRYFPAPGERIAGKNSESRSPFADEVKHQGLTKPS